MYFYGKLYFLAFFSKTTRNRIMAVTRSLVHSIVNIHAKFEVSTFYSPFTLVDQKSFLGKNTSFYGDFWWKTQFLGLRKTFFQKNLNDSDWYYWDLSTAVFRMKKFHFNPKLWVKNLAKLTKKFLCGKRHNSECIIDTVSKF